MAVDVPTLGEPVRRRRRFRVRSPKTLAVTVTFLIAFLILGTAGPSLTPDDPNALDLAGRLQPPVFDGGAWNHPLGTDDLGRDTLSRLIHGARVSLIAVGLIIPIATLIGSLLGLLAGWFGGWTSRIIMALVDLQLALPAILVAVFLAAIWGPSLTNVVIVLVFALWATWARIVRGETLSLREREFVIAARTIGANDLRIMLRHILPGLINSIVILATLNVATIVIAEAGLSFLGVGVAQDTISWGAMISQGRDLLNVAWWLVTVPGIAILTISLVINIFGDWLRDFLDPQLRNVR
ncbi:MAG: ABC transporter permease [Chloroflexota bacterium]|nr:ABC transporter permease [Chloroflexota bacterium]MDE2639017.1 ABC transporter permease [Chloroflexota bacterium]